MTKSTHYILFFLLLPFSNLLAQDIDTTLANQYLEQAKQLIEDRKIKEATPLLDTALVVFEQAGLWENWATAKRKAFHAIFLSSGFQTPKTIITEIDSTLAFLDEKLPGQNIVKYELIVFKANAHYWVGDPISAIAINEQYLPELIEFVGDTHYLISYAYSTLTSTYLRTGAFEKSLLFSLKALQIEETLSGHESAETAAAHERVSNVYMVLEQFDEALKYTLNATEIRLNIFKDDYHPRLRGSYANLGICYTELGQFDKAENYFLKSLTITEQQFGKNHSQIAGFLWNLGMFYQYADKHEKALEAFEEELEIRLALGLGGDRLAENYLRLGQVLTHLGEDEKAIKAQHKALATVSPSFTSESYLVNPKVDQVLSNILGIKMGFSKMDAFYHYLKKHPKDEKTILSALELAELCLAIWEELRYELSQEQQSKNFNVKLVRNAVQFACDISGNAFETFENDYYKNKAFELAERGKALLLQDAYLAANAQQFSILPPEITSKEKEMAQQLAQFESQLLTAFNKNDSLGIVQLRNEQLFPLKLAHEQFIQQIEQEYPAYYQSKYNTISLSPKDLQASLQSDELLVEYLIHEDADHLLIFTIDKVAGLNVYRQPMPEDIAEKADDFYKLLKGNQLNRGDKKRKFIALSHELYQLFIHPITPHLKGINKLIVIGESFSNYIPFEALLASDEIKPYEALDFLIKKHEIAYHYSASLWALSQKNDKIFDNDLLAFAPVFETSEEETTALRATTTSLDTTLRSLNDKGQYTMLIHSKEEVESISALFKEKGKNKVLSLLKEEATEERLKIALGQKYQFVHLATHSFSDMQQSDLSGIACIPALEASAENGILFSGEIYNLAINSDLAILSSCESGVGQIIRGEGMLGLNRSFVAAGVPNVIFSLWKVFDQIGSEMMIQFYQEVLQGASYAEALRKIKLDMLSKPESASPEFWAAFLLIGQ